MKEKKLLQSNKIVFFGILILTPFLRTAPFSYLLISLLTVAAVWYLTAQLFPEKKWFKEIAALSIALSDWHISLGSYSWKVSLAILLVLLGIYILIKVLKGKVLLFSVVVLVFLGNQIISPLAINLNNAPDVIWLTDQQRREHGEQYNSFLSLMLHNKVVNYSLSLLEHWGEHFTGDFLISRNPSLMFFPNILFLLVGVFNILKKGEWSSRWGVILLWLAVAPVNSVFNFGPPEPEKASLMIVPLVLISSYGVFVLLYFFQKLANFFRTS